MLQIRRAEDRGHANHGWLNSHHTFSFAGYYDREQMGWGPLRVINDDTVDAQEGFPTHSHKDMEIISYVLEGALEHKDTIGTGSVIRPGDVQMMEAGTGIAHSEFNASVTEPVHFLQIWVIPKFAGLEPSYQQRHFSDEEKRGKFRLVVSKEGQEGALRIHQDMSMYAGLFDGGETAEWTLDPSRLAYVHVARGAITINGSRLAAGDGLKIAGEPRLDFKDGEKAEVLLFDLPPT
ncbi:MAG TPA: pirin family protein [Noviherbaspirillum sp.]|nr:pirin family protein [Noviherbaspirillum sp.]